MQKKFSILAIATLIASTSYASDIDIYYMPTCPHCHHALQFIENDLKKETNFSLSKFDVNEETNKNNFFKAVKKCKLNSYGVPVIIVKDKCIQGFGTDTKTEIREALKKKLK